MNDVRLFGLSSFLSFVGSKKRGPFVIQKGRREESKIEQTKKETPRAYTQTQTQSEREREGMKERERTSQRMKQSKDSITFRCTTRRYLKTKTKELTTSGVQYVVVGFFSFFYNSHRGNGARVGGMKKKRETERERPV